MSRRTAVSGVVAVALLAAVVAAFAADLPVAPLWAPAGRLRAARDFSTATLLPDGSVLVVGGMSAKGTGAGGYLSSAELYDPAKKTWSPTAGTLQTLAHHTATLLRNGKVLIAGGYGKAGFLARAELYDPATRRWSFTGSMALPRTEHTATLLPDGRVLVAGGDDDGTALGSAELYDPSTGRWSRAGSIGPGRYLHSATLLAAGDVLIAGGYNSTGALASARLYHPATKTSSPAGAMSTRRFRHTATRLADGQVLVAGGARTTGAKSFLAGAEIYDPTRNAWSATGAMARARYLGTTTALPDGRVLAAGGHDGRGYLPTAELYDPATGTWSPTAAMATARYRATATLLPDGGVLAAGGYNAGGPSATAEVYRPVPVTAGAGGGGVTVPPADGGPPGPSGPSGPPAPVPGPGALDHLVLTPAAARIVEGGSQTYRIEGVDAAGNDLSDMTAAATLSIAPEGECDDPLHACTADVPDTGSHHTVTATAAGATGTATLTVDAATRSLFAWGDDAWGMLGDGDTGALQPTPEPITLAPGVTATKIAAGWHLSLAIGSDGDLYAWGAGGTLGDGTTDAHTSPERITLAPGVRPKAISAGMDYGMAIGSDERLYTWGPNNDGQTGAPQAIDRQDSPEVLTLAPGVTPKAISAGDIFGLAIGSDGELYGWGGDGAFGPGVIQWTPAVVKVPVGPPDHVEWIPFRPTAIAGGADFSLALAGSRLYSWGYNGTGGLGNGTTDGRSWPEAVPGVSLRAISAGFNGLGIGTDNRLYSWGRAGELGDGTHDHVQLVPEAITLGPGVTPKAIAAGVTFGLAIGSDRRLYAWGDNTHGTLGDGSGMQQDSPVPVALPPGVRPGAISAGYVHALAIGLSP